MQRHAFEYRAASSVPFNRFFFLKKTQKFRSLQFNYLATRWKALSSTTKARALENVDFFESRITCRTKVQLFSPFPECHSCRTRVFAFATSDSVRVAPVFNFSFEIAKANYGVRLSEIKKSGDERVLFLFIACESKLWVALSTNSPELMLSISLAETKRSVFDVWTMNSLPFMRVAEKEFPKWKNYFRAKREVESESPRV